MSVDLMTTSVGTDQLAKRFSTIRKFSETLAQPLSAEDCAVQSMPYASPTKWHLAHTTWFFETFLLSQRRGYRAYDESFGYLFNSYYNSIGEQFPRAQRGLMSQPSLIEVLAYRSRVDEHMADLLAGGNASDQALPQIVELGLQHEQQHQELILTDIKHAFSYNPSYPVYRKCNFDEGAITTEPNWLEYDEGIYWIGHEGEDFAFDNETPRHREFLESFLLSEQLVTCREYLRFMEDDGYQRPEFWLSLGWDMCRQQGWNSPLYWFRKDDQWHEFTLAGAHVVNPDLPVCHVSYYEAAAYARWADARLATEAEWEVASCDVPLAGNFVDTSWEEGAAIHPRYELPRLNQPTSMFGDVWEWTSSPYVPYPRYAPPSGALGEYNGKFMCNQFVLRGGSCATSSTHIRSTYRNFFPPDTRWQFTGIRLCR